MQFPLIVTTVMDQATYSQFSWGLFFKRKSVRWVFAIDVVLAAVNIIMGLVTQDGTLLFSGLLLLAVLAFLLLLMACKIRTVYKKNQSTKMSSRPLPSTQSILR